MRLRVGVVLCLFLAFLGAGCRKALAPNIDRNLAPETWITAAPQDTITARDPNGVPLPPGDSRIPFRYHLYWAGSDQDGAVAGYFFAVVETLAVAPEGLGLPQLPGPKARDYKFTSRSDSVFTFSTSVLVPERQHAFYIYAVDNNGKPDPTPARFFFTAIDRFPPLPFMVEARARGVTYSLLSGGGVTPTTRDYFLSDSLRPGSAPRDTVPSNSELHFRWRGEPTLPGTRVVGYRYKLDETDFVVVDSTVTSVSYNTGLPGVPRTPPGSKVFRLQAVGESGWRGELTRAFIMNFSPETWFAGPDPADASTGFSTLQDGNGRTYYFRDIPAWSSFAGVTNSQLSPDSVNIRPVDRREVRTFLEIYANRLWLRQEGDTVHQNSWVVFSNGGLDSDSPYAVKVNANDPFRPIGPVTTPAGPLGSPIGFRRVARTVTQAGPQIPFAQSLTYPVFDAASFARAPYMNSYLPMTTAGKAYFLARAEDGDGATDDRVGDLVTLADTVDANPGAASAGHRALRKRVMVFYVGKAPYLDFNEPAFSPRPGSTVPRNFTTRLASEDQDPFNPTARPDGVGGPSDEKYFRYEFKVIGRDINGATIEYSDNVIYQNQSNISISIPAEIVSGPITLRIKLCDCQTCDEQAGQGICKDYDIPLTLSAPQTGPADASAAPATTQRPGSSDTSRRSR